MTDEKYESGQKLIWKGDTPDYTQNATYWCPCVDTPGKSWVYFNGERLGKRDDYVMLVFDHRLEAVN